MFAGANSDAVVQRQYKDLSVANFTIVAGSSASNESGNRWIDELFVDCDLKLDFSAKIDRQLVGINHWFMALLAPKPLTVHDCQPEYFDLFERIFNRV